MAKLVFILLIGGGAIFAIQNLAPLPLVILGISTPPLPLAFWVLGSVVAGAMTTLITATLFKIALPTASPRPRSSSSGQAPQPRPTTSRFSPNPTTAPKGGASWQPEIPKNSPSSSRPPMATNGGDWEPQRSLDDWEDWEGYKEPDRPPVTKQPSPPPTRPISYNQEPVEEYYQTYAPPVGDEPEVWDDWEDEEGDRPGRQPLEEEPDVPHRTDFEVRQEPKVRYQSGSLYSYSYRPGQEAPPPNPVNSENVYDAEYRVLTPPYRPDSEVEESPEEEGWIDEDASNPPADAGDRPSTANP